MEVFALDVNGRRAIALHSGVGAILTLEQAEELCRSLTSALARARDPTPILEGEGPKKPLPTQPTILHNYHVSIQDLA